MDYWLRELCILGRAVENYASCFVMAAAHVQMEEMDFEAMEMTLGDVFAVGPPQYGWREEW